MFIHVKVKNPFKKHFGGMFSRDQYRRDAQKAYQHKMLAAHSGKGDYPKIRTFNKAENSTNSVFKDLEAAERL